MAKKKTIKSLRNKRTRNTIPVGMKAVVLAEFDRRGLTAYRLAQMVRGKMSMQAVYDYVHGGKDMMGERLMHLLDALGLQIAPVSDSVPDSKPTKSNRRKPNQKA